jgi:hypothetical protein
MVAGDFNRDGIPDLAIGGEGGAIWILLGKGDGTFRRGPANPPASTQVYSLAVGDFNEDGIEDLVFADWDTSGVVVLQGNGDGTFSSGPTIPTGPGAYAITVGDFLGNGTADLAVLNYFSNSVTLLHGDGTGAFAPLASVAPSGLGFTVVAGDFTGDGLDDLAMSLQGAPGIAVLAANLKQTATAGGIAAGSRTTQVKASYLGGSDGDSNFDPGTSAAILLPSVSLSASSLAFGSEIVNIPSPMQTVTVTNNGSAALTVNGVALTGANPESFKSSNNCGSSVAPGASCSIRARFYPQTAGDLSAAVTVTDAGNASQSIALLGTAFPAPTIQLSVTSLAFGNETADTTTSAQTVTLTNQGPGPLDFAGISLSGSNSTWFAASNDCASGLAANASCTLRVRFAPQADGPATAGLTIRDTAAGSPHAIALTGTGVSPSVQLSSTSLVFGSEAVGVASAEQAVTLTNLGHGVLQFVSIQLTGANPASFTASNNCVSGIAGGGFCTIHLRFDPQSAGPADASLAIADNAAASPQEVKLSGTGN